MLGNRRMHGGHRARKSRIPSSGKAEKEKTPRNLLSRSEAEEEKKP